MPEPSIKVKAYRPTDPAQYRQIVKISQTVGDILDLFRKIFPDVQQAYNRGFSRIELASAMILKQLYSQFQTATTIERRYVLGHKLKSYIQDPNAEDYATAARVDIAEIGHAVEDVPEGSEIGHVLRKDFSERSQAATKDLDLDGLLSQLPDIDAQIDAIYDRYAAQRKQLREKASALIDSFTGPLTDVQIQINELMSRIAGEAEKNEPGFKPGLFDRMPLTATEAYRKYESQHEELRAKRNRLESEVEALFDQDQRESQELRDQEAESSKGLKAQRDNLQKEFVSRITDAILQQSPISETQATEWANSQTVTPSAERRLKRQGYAIEDVRKDMAEFYRLTSGRLTHVAIVTEGRQRACAWMDKRKVSIDGHFSKTTLFHEMAHLLENDGKIRAVSQSFISSRIAGRQIKPLRVLDPSRKFKKDEVAWEDTFIDPYVGKVYRDGITEVLSMGMQMFATPEALKRLYESDPEMYHIMNGLLLSPLEIEAVMENAEEAEKVGQQNQREADFYNELDRKTKSADFLKGREDRIEISPYVRPGRTRPSAFSVYAKENGKVRAAMHFKSKQMAYAAAYLCLLSNSHTADELYKIEYQVKRQEAPPWYKNPKHPDSKDYIPEL